MLLPLADAAVCTQGDGAAQPDRRGARRRGAREVGGPQAVTETADPQAAYAEALRLAGAEGSVLITGSLYLLEDLAGVLAGKGIADG